MSDIINAEKNIVLSITDTTQHESIYNLGRAFSSYDRIRILQALQTRPMNLLELSRSLDIPISSVSNHIDILETAQLIFVNYQPGPKGHSKICNKMVLSATVNFIDCFCKSCEPLFFEMPVGCFTDCKIFPPCGMATSESIIEAVDDPNIFFSPQRFSAQILWFNKGSISYKFPNHYFSTRQVSRLSFSFEVCSEAVYYRNIWPSDITVSVNDIELLTFTSPGDFGGRQGKYTPNYWNINSTQFGILKNILIDESGIYLDSKLVNNQKILSSLNLKTADSIKLTLSIKDNADHIGGINIFGKNFGDYPQSIIMTIV